MNKRIALLASTALFLVGACGQEANDQSTLDASDQNPATGGPTTETSDSPPTEWEIPVADLGENRCGGTIAVRISGPAAVIDGELVSENYRIEASCDSRARLLDYDPTLEWNSAAVASFMQNDQCVDGSDRNFSGLPSRSCPGGEEDRDDKWIIVYSVVNDDYYVDFSVYFTEQGESAAVAAIDSAILEFASY